MDSSKPYPIPMSRRPDSSGSPCGPPKISFLIAVRNRASLVKRSIDSVPDSPSVEIIVCDDGSTDATPDALAVFGPRIVVLRNQFSRGAGAARNRAAEAARGQWCFILDSDNALLPGALPVIENALRACPDVGLVFLGSVRADGSLMGSTTSEARRLDGEDLLLGRISGEYCVLVRRDALRSIPYNEWPGRDNAIVTWIRIADRYGMAVFNAPVLRYEEEGADRLSGRRQSVARATEAARCHQQLLDLYGGRLKAGDPRRWAQHVGKRGFYFGLAGSRLAAVRSGAQAIVAGAPREGILALVVGLLGRRIGRWVYLQVPG